MLTAPAITAAQHLPATGFAPGRATDFPQTAGGHDFASVLARGDHDPSLSPRMRARRAAEDFVAITLVQPIFEQLRSANDAAPPFAPSQGERQFGALLDAELARRIVRAQDFPLVDEVARRVLNETPQGPDEDRRAGAGEWTG